MSTTSTSQPASPPQSRDPAADLPRTLCYLNGEYTALQDAKISVLDRGPGIADEQLPKMLQPFQRLEPSRSPASGGFGLGLAIVKALATANAWQFELSNREGGGLAARLVLPGRLMTEQA